MAEPTRSHPDHSFPTADPLPAHDTRSLAGLNRDASETNAESATQPPPAAPPGYELLDEIGHGGMGVVYRGRDLVLSRDVAVKFLRAEYAPTSLAGRRFLDEARITAQLQHPGIPPIHEIGELPDGRPYLVMKLIKGRTLAEFIAAETQTRGALVAVFEQVCQAVAYAHNHGVIHRDLKPTNVMVGAFGEVQVMDWGLAKFRAEIVADSAEALVASTFHDPRTGADEGLHTRAGSFLGTPAYMSPEQAIGAVDQIDERADVFGLGAVLCSILTGNPPFVASTPEATRQLAAQKKLEDAFTRLDATGVEPDLVSLCKRCLAGDRDMRFRNAGQVASAVNAIRVAGEERARQAELETVRIEGERQKAELRAVEQHKRRRVQLAFFVAVFLLVIGVGGFAWWQYRQDERRKSDLQTAEAAAQREARAVALVQALGAADTSGVARLLDDLKEYRDLTGSKLQEMAAQPINTKAGLHARLALLPDEPVRADEVIAYVLTCRPDEVRVLAGLLRPHVEKLRVAFLAVLFHAEVPIAGQLRYACVLAAADPADPHLPPIAFHLVEWLVASNPLEAVVWAEAVHPIRELLVPKLMARYPASRERIESGRLHVSQLVAEASACDLTASLLARYTHDRPAELAEMAIIADARHYELFEKALRDNKATVIPILEAELRKQALPAWARNGEITPALAALLGAAPVADALNPDLALETQAKRRAGAAAALLALDEPDAAWEILKHTPDPTARSYLIERLVAISVDPVVLIRRFRVETDVSVKRALVLTIASFLVDIQISQSLWLEFSRELLKVYRDHPDPGLHAAIEWAFRTWEEPQVTAEIDAELTSPVRVRVAARALASTVPMPFGRVVGPFLPAPAIDPTKNWFVNSEGQTFAVVRGPVESVLGSPTTEAGRAAVNELAHRKRIDRSFAVSTKEVTNAEFLRFLPNHNWVKRYSPGADTPVVSVMWYECAAYCNWLSAREGIPPDQWCYAPNKNGAYTEGMTIRPNHLSLTGYRLPTETEWEYACRAGSVVARPFGRGESLLPRYACFARNADDETWSVGRLRPNDLGLFDTLGNAFEWVEDAGQPYTGQREDRGSGVAQVIGEPTARLLRGGSFMYQPVDLRSAYRSNAYRPSDRGCTGGFRLARTVPSR